MGDVERSPLFRFIYRRIMAKLDAKPVDDNREYWRALVTAIVNLLLPIDKVCDLRLISRSAMYAMLSRKGGKLTSNSNVWALVGVVDGHRCIIDVFFSGCDKRDIHLERYGTEIEDAEVIPMMADFRQLGDT